MHCLLLVAILLAGVNAANKKVGSDSTDQTSETRDCRAPNMIWSTCTNLCPQRSCQNIDGPLPCFSLRCGAPACQCVDGFLLKQLDDNSQGCVLSENCPK